MPKHKSLLLAGVGILLASAALWSCSESATTEPANHSKSCRELGAELRAESKAPKEDQVYKVITPNGGEVYKVGQVLKLKAIAANDEQDALLSFKLINSAGTTQAANWPGQNESINLQDSCEFTLTIPESVSVGSRKVGLVSNKIWMRVQKYNFTNQFQDSSDASFTIQGP
jgi:hypothetical protein